MTADSISQKILPKYPANLPVRHFSRRHAGMAVEGIKSQEDGFIGLAMQRSRKGRVELLALATVREVIIISTDNRSLELLARDRPFENLLKGDLYSLVGFDMGRLCLHIASDLKLHVRGVDLATAIGPSTWKPLRPSEVVKSRINPEADVAMVDGLWINEQGHRELCLRAWLSVCIAENSLVAIQSATRLDTSQLTWQEVTALNELVRQAYVLDEAKPKETPGEFTEFYFTGDGHLELQNARYKTRIRRSNQTVIMTNESGKEFFGEARSSKGKRTNIRFNGQTLAGTLQKVRVFGPPQLTNSEKARDEFILLVLQNKASLQASFIRTLWFPGRRYRFVDPGTPPTVILPGLNASQQMVASRMIYENPLVIVHGPPGTGKTTTIAAAVSIWEQNNLPTWIIAHSNVAVKNMAETLFKKGVFFRILVSKEFHFEWHEHIYNEIQERVIVSDEILGIKNIVELERVLGPTCIMLSTLGMLSSPLLGQIGMFRIVPVGRLVVDEASQIKIEDFMHVLHKFRSSLEKLCFFGDPKQLPPYGKDEAPEIRTVFDLPHLKDGAGFLDTQYRMPVPLGHFISKYVYNGRLKSEHNIQSASCVSFVDVFNGAEIKSGFSWINEKEIIVIGNIVKLYYKHTNFCIITPYDAQRSAIERHLKAENLPWERVFNVDSFQGNEADFVLVSVVRSGPGPGFLSSLNRMNVLLTRCRKGLVIVTSRAFIREGGRQTLLGALERHWMEIRGDTWVDWRSISDGTADLPNAPGPNRARLGPAFHYVPRTSGHVVAQPVKTFDVKSLFRPSIPPVTRYPLNALKTTSLPLPSSVLSPPFTGSSGSTSTSTQTPVSTVSSSRRPWEPVISSQSQYAPLYAQTRPADYDSVFPELLVVKPSLAEGREPPSLLSAHSLHRNLSARPKLLKGLSKLEPQPAQGVIKRLHISDKQIARAHPERLHSSGVPTPVYTSPGIGRSRHCGGGIHMLPKKDILLR